MGILCIYMDYHQANLELRGKIAFTESKYKDVYEKLQQNLGLKGSIILSTCNRTEFYLHHSLIEKDASSMMDFIRSYFGLDAIDMDKFRSCKGSAAVLHLLRVTAGLESMVIGEDQILSQVKDAQERANAYGGADAVLNKLFREAITCAKEIKSRTAISENKLSVASIAADIIDAEMNGLQSKRALIVGVGEMSRLTIQYLTEKGIGEICIANRSIDRAKPLLEEFKNLRHADFDSRYELAGRSDMVISATGAPHTVFEYEPMKKACPEKSLLMIDMAVPRDMDEEIRNMKNIKLFDMDDFKNIAEKNLALRQNLISRAEAIVEDYRSKLCLWLEEADINRLLSKVDEYVDGNLSEQADALMFKLDLDEHLDREEAKSYALHLSNRALKKMILKLKDMPKEKYTHYVEMMGELLK